MNRPTTARCPGGLALGMEVSLTGSFFLIDAR